MPDFSAPPLVPVSWGEVLDKITILEIKEARITEAAPRDNVARELALLRTAAAPVAAAEGIAALNEELRRVNAALWGIEDDIRRCEARQDFGPGFVALARSVYRENDRRAAIKRRINAALNSTLVEEKWHTTGAAGD